MDSDIFSKLTDEGFAPDFTKNFREEILTNLHKNCFCTTRSS